MSPHAASALVVQAFGYTPRQAAFLAHVVRHGGYCLQRHYTACAGCGHGLATVRFFNRLVERGHARRGTLGPHGRVYHLQARRMYEACGLPPSFSRERSWRGVISALMRLDAVLLHSDATFFVTDEEKLQVLIDVEVPQETWPGARPTEAASQSRMETGWLFGREAWYRERDDPRLWLLWVETEVTTTRFERFLREHVSLLHGVSSGVLYVSPSHATAAAERTFGRVVEDGAWRPLRDWDGFLRFCRLRQHIDTNTVAALSGADIAWFRDNRAHFATALHDALYRRWREGGEVAAARPANGRDGRRDCVLRVHVSEHPYTLGARYARRRPPTKLG
jgi:hypothetical protein